MNKYYRHYVRIDENGRVISIYSETFRKPSKDDICYEESTSCQAKIGGVENPPLINNDGIFLYKWNGGKIQPRTEAEIEADSAALPPPPKSSLQRIAELEAQNRSLQEQIDLLVSGATV